MMKQKHQIRQMLTATEIKCPIKWLQNHGLKKLQAKAVELETQE